MKTLKKLKESSIKLLILDVDGVLTNGKIYISDEGVETKKFDVRDGIGLKLILENKIDIAIISGRKSKATAKRLKELGIKRIHLGIPNKMVVFNQIKEELNLDNDNIAYIGDDIPDVEIMEKVGFSIAVADATDPAKKAANYILKNKGGNCAVREACEMILEASK